MGVRNVTQRQSIQVQPYFIGNLCPFSSPFLTAVQWLRYATECVAEERAVLAYV